MKLASVEFLNFACFDKISLPIREGITVLVGRNNSGKTALLRGASLLSDLLIEPKHPIKDFNRYVRKVEAGFFGLNVRFTGDDTDQTMFQGDNLRFWKEFVDKQSPEYCFHFSVWPEGSGVTLNGCDVVTEFRSFAKLRLDSKDNCVYRPFYDVETFTERAVTRIDAGNLIHFPNGQLGIQTLMASPEAAPFEALRGLRYVGPHRVVKTTTQLLGTDKLDANAENLAAFLHAFRGDHDHRFQTLRDFVLEVFPQFKAINTHSSGAEVGIEMVDGVTGNRVPLSHCGTGVEQIMSLATAVVSAPAGSIVILDEPHTYLHPIVERQLVQFLAGFQELKIIISTHSSVIMNAVPAERIVYLNASSTLEPTGSDATSILFDLGHRNSDLLISDRLIFVEGASDRSVLPLLLLKSGMFSQTELASTGFVEMEGGGRLDGRKAQTSVLYYEKTIAALGRAKIPHIYLFDGDKKSDDIKLIDKLSAECLFLARREIENYLLIPEAISPVLAEDARDRGMDQPCDAHTVNSILEAILAREDDSRLYPIQPVGNRIQDVQGSEALERLFEAFELTYSKTKHGPRIANNISVQHVGLEEIARIVQPFLSNI